MGRKGLTRAYIRVGDPVLERCCDESDLLISNDVMEMVSRSPQASMSLLTRYGKSRITPTVAQVNNTVLGLQPLSPCHRQCNVKSVLVTIKMKNQQSHCHSVVKRWYS